MRFVFPVMYLIVMLIFCLIAAMNRRSYAYFLSFCSHETSLNTNKVVKSTTALIRQANTLRGDRVRTWNPVFKAIIFSPLHYIFLCLVGQYLILFFFTHQQVEYLVGVLRLFHLLCFQQQKMQIERLTSDFQESISRFQTLQKV
jgi:hypothetical protein